MLLSITPLNLTKNQTMEDVCDAIEGLPDQPDSLSDEQQRQLSQALSTLNTQQLAWVSGYLYGLSQAGSQPAVTGAAATAPSGNLTILYGSQTGNARAWPAPSRRRPRPVACR